MYTEMDYTAMPREARHAWQYLMNPIEHDKNNEWVLSVYQNIETLRQFLYHDDFAEQEDVMQELNEKHIPNSSMYMILMYDVPFNTASIFRKKMSLFDTVQAIEDLPLDYRVDAYHVLYDTEQILRNKIWALRHDTTLDAEDKNDPRSVLAARLRYEQSLFLKNVAHWHKTLVDHIVSRQELPSLWNEALQAVAQFVSFRPFYHPTFKCRVGESLDRLEQFLKNTAFEDGKVKNIQDNTLSSPEEYVRQGLDPIFQELKQAMIKCPRFML